MLLKPVPVFMDGMGIIAELSTTWLEIALMEWQLMSINAPAIQDGKGKFVKNLFVHIHVETGIVKSLMYASVFQVSEP